ncbi:MAG: type II toxin-antitoxin system VapC family toxin [Planctomycetes bacterium]|nr:type II toxin-antitoxin system VapC family toxin [Planctomycetota bacterium]
MKRALLDSGIISDLVNRRREVPNRIRELVCRGIRVGTCIPVLAEIVAGIECSSSRERNMKALLAVMPALTFWPFDEPAAFQYGQIFANLRRQGRPMQVVDMMLAAVALRLGSSLVITTDSDLQEIDGLSVEKW